MDDLVYTYEHSTNQLIRVDDQVPANNYTEDIDADNYSYDAIGNLITDDAEGISQINWTVYGKISSIIKNGKYIGYGYDASGNRIYKQTDEKTTVYVRDGSGNVMSIYEQGFGQAIEQTEIHIYGSSRLGLAGKLSIPESSVQLTGIYGTATLSTFVRGEKVYELSNHLGNVLVTITDRKIQQSSDNTTVEYYTADVATATDYYPFGMVMVGREFELNGYRYSINGQEKEKDINKNVTTALYWEYDSRIGKRWNIDPKPNPGLSVYSSFGDNPIITLDFLGDTTKFFGNNGLLLYQNNKDKGTFLYVVANEQYQSLNTKFKNKEKLTSELIKIGIKAYATQDDAAAAWAPEGFAATKNDPGHLERAARIFRAQAFGDKTISNLYVVGSTVTGQKSKELGVSQETDPSGSTILLNGKDITTYTQPGIRTTRRGTVIIRQEQITLQSWNVSAMTHTHPPGSDRYSISTGDVMMGGDYGGDFGIAAAGGVSVYLVPTGSYSAYRMFRLDLSPYDRHMYFRDGVREAQDYMDGEKATIFLEAGKVSSKFLHGKLVQ
jgi:hypothetical protein